MTDINKYCSNIPTALQIDSLLQPIPSHEIFQNVDHRDVLRKLDTFLVVLISWGVALHLPSSLTGTGRTVQAAFLCFSDNGYMNF